MEYGDLLQELLSALEERGAPDAIALTDLIRLEQHLLDSVSIVRRLIDALIRREQQTPHG